jgi:hypothetical protein
MSQFKRLSQVLDDITESGKSWQETGMEKFWEEKKGPETFHPSTGIKQKCC